MPWYEHSMDWSQRELAAAVADALPVGIWVARAPTGELLYANPAFGRIMGMEARGDVAAGGYTAPYGIFDREGLPYPEQRLPFVRALEQRTTVVVDDISIHRPDGSKIDVRAFAQPMFDPDGSIGAVAIAFFDVTAEVKAVRERLALEAHLAEVISEAPIMLYAFDTEGRISLSEGRGLQTVGLEPGQLVGLSVFEIYDDEPQVLSYVRRVLAGEELREVFAYGPYLLESSLRPVRDREGKVTGAIGVAVNVTEREFIRAQLSEADRMALLGTVSASVAHEVNTPLSYIESSLTHLARELDKGVIEPEVLPKLKSLVADAGLGASRVKTIARDLNSFSKPQERVAPVEIHEVIESAMRMSSHETSRRAQVVRQFQPGRLEVDASEPQLAQVFLNLLLNAAQAIPVGQAEAHEILVRTFREDAWVVAEIVDSGQGIPPEVLPRIFEPRFTTKPLREGTGLGLTICRKIVTRFGGEILADSAPGRTRFRIRLPASKGSARSSSNPKPGSEAAWPGKLSGRPRVLVIDDDRALLRVLGITLDDLCDLEMASSGAEGVERLLNGPQPDVVLCDLMMAGYSGMDVYRTLERERPGLEACLAYMTGGAFTREAREFLSRIPNPWFEKPFDFAEVISKLLHRSTP